MQYILYNPAKYAVTFAVTHPVTAFSFVSYCFSLADTPLSAESKKANDSRELLAAGKDPGDIRKTARRAQKKRLENPNG